MDTQACELILTQTNFSSGSNPHWRFRAHRCSNSLLSCATRLVYLARAEGVRDGLVWHPQFFKKSCNKKRPAGVLDQRDASKWSCRRLEGEPYRVLKFSIAVRCRPPGTCLGIRRAILDRHRFRQRGRRIAVRVQKLRTRGSVHGIEVYVSQALIVP